MPRYFERLFVAVSVLLIATTGCSTARLVPLDIQHISSESVEMSTPSAGEPSFSSVGDTVLSDSYREYYPVLIIDKQIETDQYVTGSKVDIPPQTVWPAGTLDNYIMYRPSSCTEYVLGNFGASHTSPSCDAVYIAYSTEDQSGHVVSSRKAGWDDNSFRAYDVKILSHVHIEDRESQDSSNYDQELVFLGFDGDVANFMYQERWRGRYNESKRQSVQHSLSDSSILEYQGTKIEIEKVSNTEIRYRVIGSFEKPSPPT